MKKKILNEYDDTKRMLKTLRDIKTTSDFISEQIQNGEVNPEVARPNIENGDSSNNEDKSYNVINGVEVVINSTDRSDRELSEEEKNNFSQLIDDFRKEISKLVEFGKLNIFDDGAKLDGELTHLNFDFIFSVGDDNGLFLNSNQLLKINDEVLNTITNLKEFSDKFVETIDNFIANRRLT